MRRRDFLALCAAAVGCAAVPALASNDAEPRIRPTLLKWWRPVNGEWQHLAYDGNVWIVVDRSTPTLDCTYPVKWHGVTS